MALVAVGTGTLDLCAGFRTLGNQPSVGESSAKAYALQSFDSPGVRSFRPLFRGAAGRLNTALGRPAVFPFRVLYGCAPPGHRKTLGTKKPHSFRARPAA